MKGGESAEPALAVTVTRLLSGFVFFHLFIKSEVNYLCYCSDGVLTCVTKE